MDPRAQVFQVETGLSLVFQVMADVVAGVFNTMGFGKGRRSEQCGQQGDDQKLFHGRMLARAIVHSVVLWITTNHQTNGRHTQLG